MKPDYDGIRLEPAIPADWDGYQVTRKFRGDTYRIEVKNPDHVSSGVQSIRLDGKKLTDSLIPVCGDGKEHHVEVLLGNA